MPPMLSFHIHAVAVVNNKQKTNNNTMRVIPTANIIVQIITSRNTNVITYVTQTIQYNRSHINSNCTLCFFMVRATSHDPPALQCYTGFNVNVNTEENVFLHLMVSWELGSNAATGYDDDL